MMGLCRLIKSFLAISFLVCIVSAYIGYRELYRERLRQHSALLEVARPERLLKPKEFPASHNSKFAVFYNVYLPTDENLRQRTHHIQAEQIDQIDRVSAITNATIYYNLIGYDGRDVNFCRPKRDDISCHFMQHYKQGFEEVTPSRLHEYCILNPNNRVVYLHNKGSYSLKNTHVRRIATKAALSQECLNSRVFCNVCGTVFQTQPFLHFSSNMWTADCSYIMKLVPPLEYEKRRRELCKSYTDDLYNDTEHRFCPDKATNPDGADRGSIYGFGRHAMERWVVSHPALQPCQVLPPRLAMGDCKNGTCDWTPKLWKPRRMIHRINRNMWTAIRFQAREYEILYGETEGFCQFFYNGLSPDVCTLQEFSRDFWMDLEIIRNNKSKSK